jgi:hypothetical protein
MLDDIIIQGRGYLELEDLLLNRKLNDAFKECVGCIMYIQSNMPSKVLHRHVYVATVLNVSCAYGQVKYDIVLYLTK